MQSIAQTPHHDNIHPFTRGNIAWILRELGDAVFLVNGKPMIEEPAWKALEPADQVLLVRYADVVAEVLGGDR